MLNDQIAFAFNETKLEKKTSNEVEKENFQLRKNNCYDAYLLSSSK